MKKNEMLSEEVLEKVSAGYDRMLDPQPMPTYGEQSQAPELPKALGALDSVKEIPPLQKEQCNLSLTPVAYSQIQSKEPKKKILNPGN